MTKQDTWPKWYAVHTAPKGEGIADRNLRRLGYWTFYPFHRVRVRRKRPNHNAYTVAWVERPYFSRYLFLALRSPTEGLYGVNECDGVSTVVYNGDEPAEIPHAVMDRLINMADGAGQVGVIDETEAIERRKLSRGETISPLDGLIAQVEVDGGKAVKVWVEMLGSRRLATVSHTTVSQLAP